MAGARYVLLGLAPARAAWFSDVARWSNASAIAAEFVKAVSAAEVRARLAGGRPFSALLVDATMPSLDRDLVDTAQRAGCAVIVVGDRRGSRDWVALGANASLGSTFDRKEMLDVLAAHSTMIGRADHLAGDDVGSAEISAEWRAPLAAVCGPGGRARQPSPLPWPRDWAPTCGLEGRWYWPTWRCTPNRRCCTTRCDIVPGISELVEVCRSGQPTLQEVRSLAYAVADREYALLLGLRRSRAWATVRPRSFAAALDALRRADKIVVADVDAEVEGEDEGGSMDVEERHVMARTALSTATVVMVVGAPGMKGVHSLVRVTSEILAFGVPSASVLPVINRARAPPALGRS